MTAAPCACPHPDATACYAARYPRDVANLWRPTGKCACACHWPRAVAEEEE